MTALKEYARLEAPGLWRPEPEAQRRDVVVFFGESSLVIADKTGVALTHWSLATVLRANPGQTPALYTPTAEAIETLEISEEVMIDAIERVRRAILKARPARGRLRLAMLGVGFAGVVAAAITWLPDALLSHTLSVVPEPSRAEIGTGLFRAIGRVAGSPCRSERGDLALAQLHARLVAPRKGGLLVMPDAVTETMSLPGGLILIGRGLVEDHENPDVLAGFILAEMARIDRVDPLRALLEAGGLPATLRLLTTGSLPQTALDSYAEMLVKAPSAPVPDDELLRRFAEADVSSTAYAYARDVTGETTLPLIEADPMREVGGRPALEDGAWVALQGICGG